ncbi:SixA phosphatase family protein [Methylobacter sp.]|uniref:SixA phosphatase family protein n=1 Tax=Methylobacter sp. TaxID=2051955 RepID=UPI002FDC7FA6
MTHELLLLRHAKSDWAVDMDDFSRPLKKRGRCAAKQVGRWLCKQHLIPDTILSSPAARALATAQRVCRQLDIDESAIVCDSRIYEADAATLLTVLKNSGHGQRVLLVGHNPGLENLLLKLIPHSVPLSLKGKCLPTAALAQLSFEGDWTDLTEGGAKLVTLIRPDSLPE